MVTAELAACLPVLVLVLGVALSALAFVSARVRVLDAAREAARVAARSAGRNPAAEARRIVDELAPGARPTLTRNEATTTAVVTMDVHPFTGLLPAVTVTGRAVAATEPDPAGASP